MHLIWVQTLTKDAKKVRIIGSAETRTSTLQPARGMIRYAIRISNDDPTAHTVCTSIQTITLFLH